MDFSSHLLERVRFLADPQTQSLLKFCQLAIATLHNAQVPRVYSDEPVQDAQVLSIHCPNRFSAGRLVPKLIGGFGLSIHPLGIEQVLLSNGEGYEALYVWQNGSFMFTIPGLDAAALDFE
ncbi:MAG: hypothetical protein HC772_00130 [Leptolyngbyaceae cyanobacterium CRU_2_3]|nr:hypothetical protein [Acaryochloris sp. RU_4_1]NJR64087.1 hypothetical protein [Leptolyngbyaceae cyanobacterium CRU_2_3]